MEVDSERTTGLDIIQVGTMDVPVKDGGKRPIVLDNPVKELVPEGKAANDHEASSSQSHHFLPKWCPTGLTRTHRRKLQRLRFRERREQELEKQRDEFFNQNRPMIPQRKEWRPKEDAQPDISQAVRPAAQVVQTAGSTDRQNRRSDRLYSRLDRLSQRSCPRMFLLILWLVTMSCLRFPVLRMKNNLLIIVLCQST